MDEAAITSAAQAVHQELVRKLAKQARINRLRDQLRRARSEVAAPAPGGSGIASCWPAWSWRCFSLARSARNRPPAGRPRRSARSRPAGRRVLALAVLLLLAGTGGHGRPGPSRP